MSKFFKILKKYPQTFWVANTMELFERWAWYGMWMLLALYLTGSTDSGALGFSQETKGLMMGTVGFSLYFLPVFTGAIADRFGYKKVLIVSFIILAIAYFIIGQLSDQASVFSALILLTIGGALFKPIISATVAKTTDDETSSLGFGIFYMIVNFGALIGPVISSLSKQGGWENVFNISAGIIALNAIIVIIFFKDPEKVEVENSFREDIKRIFSNIFEALKDFKFFLFLIILVGFWTMYNQLFFSLGVFIDQWMDTSILYEKLFAFSPWLAETLGTSDKTIAAELLTNLDAMYIVIFQLVVSYFVMKLKPIHSMIVGFFVSTIGLSLMFITKNPMFLFVSILIFGLGEMAGSPKITEYIGKIAPKGKTALYMGCSFLPLAGGNAFAGYLAGPVYQKYSDKIYLLQQEVASRKLVIPDISEKFTQTDYVNKACELMNMNNHELTNYLWYTYHPYNIWIIFAAIGGGTVVAMLLFNWLVLGRKK